METSPPVAQVRRRGRPPATEADRARTRAAILDATATVFARHGYHAVTVAKIIETAGIAKSHYYRYFPNADEPMSIVLQGYAEEVVDRISGPLQQAGLTSEERLLQAIEGYLQWSRANRDMLGSYTAALHDETTPMNELRNGVTRQATALIIQMFEADDRTPPHPAEIDVLLNTVEYTCYRLQTMTDPALDDVTRARSLMIRAAVALLGDRGSWEHVLTVPGLVRPGPPTN